MDEADWQRLIGQLRRGDCTPFLGAGACAGVLPGGSELAGFFARKYGYPFKHIDDLAHVMQYAAAILRDTVDLKNEVCQYLRDHATSRPAPPYDPHSVLTRFPLDTFLTTNYDSLLGDALRACGKEPTEAISPWWNADKVKAPSLAEPTPERPLVYHLHGSWVDKGSLVLTESDYLSYLVNMVDAAASPGHGNLLPRPVFHALTSRPLLFIGYGLQDWTFRVLFHGLVRNTPRSNKRRHISVQLMPEVNDMATDAAEAERKAERYLEHYLDGWNISTFFGSAADFCTQLLARMEAKA